jgi:hypothetical protein
MFIMLKNATNKGYGYCEVCDYGLHISCSQGIISEKIAEFCWASYCDVLPVNTSNNYVGCGFLYLDLLDITSGGVTVITLPITSREQATSSGSSSAPSWRKPLLSIFLDELLLMSSYSRLLLQTPIADFIADCRLLQ